MGPGVEVEAQMKAGEAGEAVEMVGVEVEVQTVVAGVLLRVCVSLGRKT